MPIRFRTFNQFKLSAPTEILSAVPRTSDEVKEKVVVAQARPGTQHIIRDFCMTFGFKTMKVGILATKLRMSSTCRFAGEISRVFFGGKTSPMRR